MKIVTVVALAMVVLVSRTAFADSDGKIPLSTSLVVVRVILPSVQRNPMTFAAPGPAIAAPDGLITFLMDIASGVTYHPDFGAFSDYVDTSISFDSRNILGSLGSPWQLIGLGVESHFSSSFTVRAAMKENLYSIGGGVRIKGFEINCTFHTLGFAEHAISGLSLDGVFRW
jgi:hypothetical protein